MIAASIVCYNTEDSELIRCIDSLSSDCLHSIDIIDNSRSSRTEALCRSLAGKSGCRLNYFGSENRGYGAGHNQSIRRSIESGIKYHLVVNSDISFDPQALDRLLEVMQSDDRIGVLQPRIVNPDGTDQYTVRRLPTPFDLIMRRFLPRNWFAKRRRRYELRDVDHDRPFNVPYHQGSFMLLRTDALREVGLFDERFFMYPEDIDLTRRIHRRYLTLYTPVATVVHNHHADSYRSRRMMWIHIRNMIRYFNKWGWFNDSERRRFNSCL